MFERTLAVLEHLHDAARTIIVAITINSYGIQVGLCVRRWSVRRTIPLVAVAHNIAQDFRNNAAHSLTLDLDLDLALL